LDVLHGYATIQLTRGQNTLVDAEDLARYSAWKWYAKRSGSGSCRERFYAVRDVRSGSIKTQVITLHREILERRQGRRPEGFGRFLNNDSLDNRSSNLTWVTAPCPGVRRPRGEAHGLSRLASGDIVRIRERSAAGESQRFLAKEYGVSQPTIHSIATGKTWRHVV
jgi:hypothetical protein